jgi:tetratricopeptide (TPR) repeat protein
MLSPETAESARSWYETGVRRIGTETAGIGINYLERAIPVFAEVGDLRHLTYARHYVLYALKQDERFEEVEGRFADAMTGYAELGDTYGQALLLAHLADSLAAQGRWERAHALFNLAAVVAENDQHRDIVVHVLWQQGLLCRQRDNLTHAVKLFQRAERLLDKESGGGRLPQLRFLRAQVLSLLGETAEAIALLEDVQTHLLRTNRNQLAMEPLNLLRRLYEDEGMAEERARVSQLMHLSGQRMIQADLLPRLTEHLGPPIDPALGQAGAPAGSA